MVQFAELNRLLKMGGLITYDNAKCDECGRVFDLTDATDASEWSFGHDCEEES